MKIFDVDVGSSLRVGYNTRPVDGFIINDPVSVNEYLSPGHCHQN